MSAGRLLSAANKGNADGGAFVSFLCYIASACPPLCSIYSVAVCHPAYLCTINSARDVCRCHCKKQSEQTDGKLAKLAHPKACADYALYDDALFSGTAERNGINSGRSQSAGIISSLV